MKGKYIKIIVLLLLVLTSLCLSLGCDGCNQNNGNDNDGGVAFTPKLELSAASTTMIVLDTYQIVATTNVDGQVAWKSSNEGLATVDGTGLVSAKAVGEVVIQAEVLYGEESITKKCYITVLAETRKPTLKVENIGANDELILGKNSVYQLKSAIYFDGKPVDGVIEYTSLDQNIATVSQSGEICTKDKIGTVEISVKGSYRDFTEETLSLTVKLTVKDGTMLIVEFDSDQTLYGIESYAGRAYKNKVGYTATLVTENERVSTGITLVSKTPEIAVVEGNQIVAKGYGVAEIEASIDYNGTQYKKSVFVNVDGRVEIDNTADYSTVFERKKDISLSAFNAYAHGDEITSVYYLEANGTDREEINIVDGRFENLKTGDGTVLILTPLYSVKQSLHVVDYMVTDKASLAKAFKDLDGSYIELGADIDGAEINAGVGTYLGMTFDGKGHVLSNITCGGRGIFGYQLSSSTVKNVAFVNLTNNGTQGLLAQVANASTTFENIFISGKSKNGKGCFQSTDSTVKFNNCIFSYEVSYESGDEYLTSIPTATQTNVIFDDGKFFKTYEQGLPSDFGGDFRLEETVLYFNNAIVMERLLEGTPITGSLYNGELYYFDKSANAQTYTLVVPQDVGDITEVFINTKAITGFSYEISTRTLTLPAERVKALSSGEALLFLVSDEVVHQAKVTVADYVVTDAASLKTAFSNLNGKYIALGADISGATVNAGAGVSTGTTFDGKGHTLTNITCGGRALFGMTLSASTVKNVAFVNLTNNGTQALLSQVANSGTSFENIFVSGSTATTKGFLSETNNTVKFNNCVFSYQNANGYVTSISTAKQTNVVFNGGNFFTDNDSSSLSFGDFGFDAQGNLTFNGKAVLVKP